MDPKYNFNLPAGSEKAEIVVREVDEVNELPVKEPVKIDINGTFGAITAFLDKRWNASDNQIDHNRSHLIVDRDHMTITLITNEHDAYNRGQVKGTLQFSRQYKEFAINTNTTREPAEMAQFFKMYKSCFADKTQNMELVSVLKNYKANIAVKIEREVKENGSFKDNYAGVVNSNLPSGFTLEIPIFKGQKSERIDVEFYAKIDGREVALALCSPGAMEIVEEVRDRYFDDEITKIKAVAPDLTIVEI